ncbi:hypothetical protein M011DRAFT_30942 [Sporormia fimetaria CBS 119925]|uniref:Uncharacterized protein n=1 Tax=Sporormia fimetaria CBS 119925 TaxID=1340428 RepID=A0A6A6VFW3_9PLEO|nr:hypothetical protein M011DRAFT_30942 [Sporormia fimetaria CBS 119925]
MQRGQGRGRGRNSNPARTPSRRGINSTTTRRSTSRSQTRRATSLRRSARLAQLPFGHILPDNNPASSTSDANGSMADVARPRALGNRTTRSRHHSNRTPGRSRGGRHSLSPEEIRYAMDVVLQPPATARAGYPLNGAIVVRLRTTNTDAERAVMDSASGSLVAFASLVPGPNSTTPHDPAVLNSLLAGARWDTIRPFSDDVADGSIGSMEIDDPHGVGFMLFNGLTIRQAGTYRIRITLIRIQDLSADPPAPSGGGVSVQVVDSNPIQVQGGTMSAAHNGKYLYASAR